MYDEKSVSTVDTLLQSVLRMLYPHQRDVPGHCKTRQDYLTQIWARLANLNATYEQSLREMRISALTNAEEDEYAPSNLRRNCKTSLFLFLHGLDSPHVSSRESQFIVATLASHPYIHVAASINGRYAEIST